MSDSRPPVQLDRSATTLRVEYPEGDAAFEALARRVEALLVAVDVEYMVGLERVVLSNASSLPARAARRLHDKRLGRVLASYHPSGPRSGAWIELFADRILDRRIAPWRQFPFIRDLFLGRVLFHEIGHHINRAVRQRPEASEAGAERWRRALMRNAFSGHLGLARVPLRLLLFLVRGFRRGRPGTSGSGTE